MVLLSPPLFFFLFLFLFSVLEPHREIALTNYFAHRLLSLALKAFPQIFSASGHGLAHQLPAFVAPLRHPRTLASQCKGQGKMPTPPNSSREFYFFMDP